MLSLNWHFICHMGFGRGGSRAQAASEQADRKIGRASHHGSDLPDFETYKCQKLMTPPAPIISAHRRRDSAAKHPPEVHAVV
jgi:hypothetical protein